MRQFKPQEITTQNIYGDTITWKRTAKGWKPALTFPNSPKGY